VDVWRGRDDVSTVTGDSGSVQTINSYILGLPTAEHLASLRDCVSGESQADVASTLDPLDCGLEANLADYPPKAEDGCPPPCSSPAPNHQGPGLNFLEPIKRLIASALGIDPYGRHV
jgi:hypothetical protein